MNALNKYILPVTKNLQQKIDICSTPAFSRVRVYGLQHWTDFDAMEVKFFI